MSPEEKKIPKFTFEGRRMTEEEIRTLMKLAMAVKDNPKIEKPLDEDDKLSEDFSTQVFCKRIEFYKLSFMVSNFFLVFSLTCWVDNPGKIMMLLRLVYQEWKKTGKTYFDLNDLCMVIFPLGFPTEEEQRSWWDSQKASDEPLGNMVDNPEYWK